MPSQRSPLASLKLDLEDNNKAEAKKTKKGKKAKTARGGGGASPREDEDDEDPTRLSSNRYQRHSWGSRPYGASNAAAGSDDDDDGHVSWEMTSHDDGSRGRGDRNHDDDYGGFNQDRGRRGGVGRRDDDDDDEEEDDDGDDDDYDARAEQASAATAAAAGKRARSSTARTSGGGAEQAESSSSAQHPWSRALAKCDGDVEKAMDHSDLAPTGNGKTVRGKFADLRAAVGRLSGTAPAPGGGAPAAAPSRSFEDPLLAVPNPRCFFCGFCDKFFLLSTLGDVKGMKKHMADAHNPSLAKVLDPPEKDPTTFATMVDPTDQPFRLSAAQCRARYQLAPTVAVVVASKKHKYVTDADEYIDEL